MSREGADERKFMERGRSWAAAWRDSFVRGGQT